MLDSTGRHVVLIVAACLLTGGLQSPACASDALRAAEPPLPQAPAPPPTSSPLHEPPSTPEPGSSLPPSTAPLGVPTSSPAGTASDATSEVTVEADEPKYVAPTLRDRIGRIWAPVLINGKGPYRLVLDTGASHSAIIARVAESLGAGARGAPPILVRGVTGSAIVPAIRVERMEVGELLIEPTTLPIVPDVFGGADGVLGREGLPDKRIFADFGHDRLVISRSHRQRPERDYTVIPLRLSRGGLLTMPVRVGTVRALAVIDTGAQQTVGNIALRDALMKHPLKDPTKQDIIGVTLDLERGDTLTAPPIEIGSLKIRSVRVTFANMSLFDHLNLNREPVMMIGMDVLGSFDILIIDYRTREMQIRMRAAAR